MVSILCGSALVAYLAAAVLVGRSLAAGRPAVPPAVAAVVAVAVALHAGGLGAYVTGFGELPLVGLAPSLSTLAFLIGVCLLAAGVFRDTGALGLVLLPLIVILLLPALMLGIAPAGEPAAYRGLWFSAHVVLAFVGYAGLAVAFAAGLLYLLQFRELKEKRFGRMFRFFPSLSTLDRLGRQALAVGFPGLTLGIVLGWALTARFPETGSVQPQIIWGLLTWFVFLAAVLSRLGGAGADRRGALASVVGFLVVFLSYVVLRIWLAEGRVFL